MSTIQAFIRPNPGFALPQARKPVLLVTLASVLGLISVIPDWSQPHAWIVPALVLAVALGVVPVDKAFSGFSDDIVIIVGSALVVSAATG